jgi:signal transduction histidine kinase
VSSLPTRTPGKADERSSVRSSQAINKKILRAFAIQLVLVSLVTVLGIFVTNWIVQDLLTEEALKEEANYFWNLYAHDPAVPLPNTQNLTGYLRPAEGAVSRSEEAPAVPEPLRDLTPGYGRVGDLAGAPLVFVSDRGGARLYLVFALSQVSDLAFYYGLLPLALIMLVIYVLALATYRTSISAISPLVRLAEHLQSYDYTQRGSLDLEPFREANNSEVNSMVDAISHFADRVERDLEREKVFARDAGHELRTPLAVFKGSLDLLERNQDRPKHDLDALQRMRRTADNMQTLLQTLLILAREELPVVSEVAASLNQAVCKEADLLSDLAARRRVALTISEGTQVQVDAPTEMLEILISNLVRNAVNYSPGGRVELVVEPDALIVRDSGVGMSEEEQQQLYQAFYRGAGGRNQANGHGLGLAIVKRIADRYGWDLTVESALGEGTEFRVAFRTS